MTFDPSVIGYREILEIYFAFHDPTTLDRQGPDVGSQYRSAIFAIDAEQAREAREMIASLADTFADPIVTTVQPLETFWPAEAYHRTYFRLNPGSAYCQATIAPKVAKLRSKWSHRLKVMPE